MMRHMILATAIATFAAVTIGEAEARSRSGSITGPRGTTTYQAQRDCSGGTCTRSGSATGPAGLTRSWQGSRTCAGGTCTSNGSVTGPYGGTATYSGTSTRAP